LKTNRFPDIQVLKKGILVGDRITLSRAITLIESTLEEDRDLAEALLLEIYPETGKALRIGISGVPGVGKSTFIDSFGTYLTDHGHKVAVLAIDPSSGISGGSILGDKTRMEKLSLNPAAFIRPTPSSGFLGGVARSTRESILLCEAAGFDIVLVETVGVGQSETTVHGMTDFFLLLMLAGAGDELQGIKKGIMEMADAVVINKADGNNITASKIAAAEYKAALHLFEPKESGFHTEVLLVSSHENTGMQECYTLIQSFNKQMLENGHLQHRRTLQNTTWFRDAVHTDLISTFMKQENKDQYFKDLEQKVEEGNILPSVAARSFLTRFFS
jgi:LAO/AO transport system kinase